MIHIEKGQLVPDNTNLLVYSETGDYNDNELIDCCGTDNMDKPTVSFQAQFIKYGGLIYHYNEPKELGEAILKIDPESTHSAASYVRMSNELLKQMNEGSLESNSSNNTLSDEQNKIQELIDDPELNGSQITNTEVSNTVSETNSDLETNNLIEENGPTVLPTAIDTNISTTTPEVIEEIPPISTDATSTPSILEEINNASSTVSDVVSMVKKITKKNKV